MVEIHEQKLAIEKINNSYQDPLCQLDFARHLICKQHYDEVFELNGISCILPTILEEVLFLENIDALIKIKYLNVYLSLQSNYSKELTDKILHRSHFIKTSFDDEKIYELTEEMLKKSNLKNDFDENLEKERNQNVENCLGELLF